MQKRKWMATIFTLLVAASALTGCQSTSVFHWGRYESLVYTSYADPDNATAPIQIETLQKDIEKAKKNQLKIAPGIFAQLGYMYVIAGDRQQAKSAFEQEKTLFPESQVFMDTLIQKLKLQEKTDQASNKQEAAE